MTAQKIDNRELAQQLMTQANAVDEELVSPNGLPNQLPARVLETALE